MSAHHTLTERALAELDEIDWSAMDHAYGPASDVPEILRGLLSDDFAEREESLDAFYGAVHHQGDVYQCTAACVPFLLQAALDPSVKDRGELLRLVASVAGVSDGTIYSGPDPYVAAARSSVTMATPRLLALADDEDSSVREHLASVLVACPENWDDTVAALMARTSTEPDAQARCSAIEAIALVARHWTDEQRLNEVKEWLAGWMRSPDDPAIALKALAALASIDSTAIAADVRGIVVDAVNRAYEVAPAPSSEQGVTEPVSSASTLVGAIRLMTAQENAGVRLPNLGPLLREVDTALGSRVADRVAITCSLLQSPSWEVRRTACYIADSVVRGWRGDYSELARLIGDLLRDDEPRIRQVAEQTLHDFGPEAAAATDALATAWESPSTTSDHLLQTLAETGDPRALVAIRNLLENGQPPDNIGSILPAVEQHTIDLLPLLLSCLRKLGSARQAHQDHRIAALASAIGTLGPDAASAVPDLAKLIKRGLHQAQILRALANIGPAAAPTAKLVAKLMREDDSDVRLNAASAWWSITGDPEPVFPVISAALTGDNIYVRREGAELAGELGPRAIVFRPQLKQLLETNDDTAWNQVHAAIALWQIGGEPEPTVLSLIDAARRNTYTLKTAVECFTQIGPPAQAALPLLTEELAQTRRHSGDSISEDIELQRLCRHAIERITTKG